MGSEPARTLKHVQALKPVERAKKLNLDQLANDLAIEGLASHIPVSAAFIEQIKRANDSISEIRMKKLAAEEFLTRCQDNKKSLGTTGYRAELTKANTIIFLADKLEVLCQKAIDSQDSSALGTIIIASRMLSINVERYNLLYMETYPPDELGKYVAGSILSHVDHMTRQINNFLESLPASFKEMER